MLKANQFLLKKVKRNNRERFLIEQRCRHTTGCVNPQFISMWAGITQNTGLKEKKAKCRIYRFFPHARDKIKHGLLTPPP